MAGRRLRHGRHDEVDLAHAAPCFPARRRRPVHARGPCRRCVSGGVWPRGGQRLRRWKAGREPSQAQGLPMNAEYRTVGPLARERWDRWPGNGGTVGGAGISDERRQANGPTSTVRYGLVPGRGPSRCAPGPPPASRRVGGRSTRSTPSPGERRAPLSGVRDRGGRRGRSTHPLQESAARAPSRPGRLAHTAAALTLSRRALRGPGLDGARPSPSAAALTLSRRALRPAVGRARRDPIAAALTLSRRALRPTLSRRSSQQALREASPPPNRPRDIRSIGVCGGSRAVPDGIVTTGPLEGGAYSCSALRDFPEIAAEAASRSVSAGHPKAHGEPVEPDCADCGAVRVLASSGRARGSWPMASPPSAVRTATSPPAPL